MAKDPAFLFYTADFYIGTVEMTDEQVGRYIRLMCLQHQKGHLSEQAMLKGMGGVHDELIMSKFVIDEDGKYYNERLDAEIEKRNKFTTSRRKNLEKSREEPPEGNAHMDSHMEQHMGAHMDNHMGVHTDSHMDSHMENENVNENKDIKEDINDKKKTNPRARKEPGRKRSNYGWVVLTDTEYARLLQDLGSDELSRCIDYIDESAQTTGNKNKWKDWNLVIRKCNREQWGNKVSYPVAGKGPAAAPQKKSFSEIIAERNGGKP